MFGKVEPVGVYEIMAPAGTLSDAEQELRGLFAEGLAAYRARDWDRSEQRFARCLTVMSADGPAAVFRRREFVKLDCGACCNVALLPEASMRAGLPPVTKAPDLQDRLRCRGCGRKGRVVSVKWRGQGG